MHGGSKMLQKVVYEPLRMATSSLCHDIISYILVTLTSFPQETLTVKPIVLG